jgi:hypothetical protein
MMTSGLDAAMTPHPHKRSWKYLMMALAALAASGGGCASVATAQTAREFRGPPGVVPLTVEEPPARLIVDPPVPEWLADGRIVIAYRAENLRIVPVFGPAALAITPRVGHIHVTVDDLPWHWADASGEPLIIVPLASGPHRVRIDLVDANHRTLDQQTVEFTVP